MWNIWLVRHVILFDNGVFDCGKVVVESLVFAAHGVKAYVGSSNFSINEFLYGISEVRQLNLTRVRFRPT